LISASVISGCSTANGQCQARQIRRVQRICLATHEDLVRQLVAEQPDITLAEIKAVLATEKVTVGQSSISRFLHH